MKKVLLFVLLASSVASAETNLQSAISDVQNDVNIKQVAEALVCAETGSHCELNRPDRPYAIELGTLNEAVQATQIYSPEDIQRLKNGIELLEKRIQIRRWGLKIIN